MKIKSQIIIILFLFLCGLLFWPTLYRYDKVKINNSLFVLRINRITGKTKQIVQEEKPSKKHTIELLPNSECNKVTGKAYFSNGLFYINLYNGSHWLLTKLRFFMVCRDANNKKLWSRFYIYDSPEKILPFSASSFSIPVIDTKDTYFPQWTIINAWGHKSKIDFQETDLLTLFDQDTTDETSFSLILFIDSLFALDSTFTEKPIVSDRFLLSPNQVIVLQAGLKCMGYKVSKIDGIMGHETRNAVDKYLQEHDFK